MAKSDSTQFSVARSTFLCTSAHNFERHQLIINAHTQPCTHSWHSKRAHACVFMSVFFGRRVQDYRTHSLCQELAPVVAVTDTAAHRHTHTESGRKLRIFSQFIDHTRTHGRHRVAIWVQIRKLWYPHVRRQTQNVYLDNDIAPWQERISE